VAVFLLVQNQMGLAVDTSGRRGLFCQHRM